MAVQGNYTHNLTISFLDWQQLADQHKDNAVMSRILKERYDANRPQEKEPVVVRFGQSPESRKDVFSKFVRTVCHACKSDIIPVLSGSGKLKTVTGKVENVTGKQTNYSSMNFNFDFTPVRGNSAGDVF